MRQLLQKLGICANLKPSCFSQAFDDLNRQYESSNVRRRGIGQRRRITRSFWLSPRGGGNAKSIKVGVGTLLGELALFTETTRPVTATALEPSTVLCIPRSLFLKMLEGYPDAAVRLREILAKRTDESERDMQRLRAVIDPSARG
jgi:cyclic nucleotide-binding protein